MSACPRCGGSVAWLKYKDIDYCEQCCSALYQEDMDRQCEQGRLAERIARRLKEMDETAGELVETLALALKQTLAHHNYCIMLRETFGPHYPMPRHPEEAMQKIAKAALDAYDRTRNE